MTEYALTPDVLPYVGYGIQSPGEHKATIAFLRAVKKAEESRGRDTDPWAVHRFLDADIASNEYMGAMAALRGGLVRMTDGGGHTLTKYGRVYLEQREQPAKVGEMNEAAMSKPGKHGTLHLYLLRYRGEEEDPGALPDEWRTWAYDSEHAIDKFYDSNPDQGWKVISWELVQDSAQHRAKRHEMRESGGEPSVHPGAYLPINIGETVRFSAHGADFLVKYHSRNTFVLSTDPPGQRRKWGTRDQIMNDIAYAMENGVLPLPRGGSKMFEAPSRSAEFHVGDHVSVSAPHGEERGKIVGLTRQTLQIDFGGTVQPFRRDKEGNWRDPGGSKVRIAVSGGGTHEAPAGEYKKGDRFDYYGEILTIIRISKNGQEITMGTETRDTFGKKGIGKIRTFHPRDMSSLRPAGPDPYDMRETSHPAHGHVSAAQARAVGDRLGVDWRHVPFEEFRKGLGVELEHSDITGGDLVKTAKIVLAHLAEADDYYARLDLVGLEPR